MADELTIVKTRARTATIVAVIGIILAAGFAGWSIAQYNFARENGDIIRAIVEGNTNFIQNKASYIQSGLRVNPDELLKIMTAPGVPIIAPCCPIDCQCLTEKEAGNLPLCYGKKIICEKKDDQIKYCYERPVVRCPNGCQCLTIKEALDQNFVLCQGKVMVCEKIPGAPTKYCFQKPDQVCPTNCQCLTEEEAGNLGFCGGVKKVCQKRPLKYCYERQVAPCPTDCQCLTEAQAKEQGLLFCQGQVTLCESTPGAPPKYCYHRAGITSADVEKIMGSIYYYKE